MGCTTSCLSPPETPPNPERIDLSHFELLKVVGKGGFGKVNAITRKFDGSLVSTTRRHRQAHAQAPVRGVGAHMLASSLGALSSPLSQMALKRMAKHEVIRKESSIRMVWTERCVEQSATWERLCGCWPRRGCRHGCC